MEAKTDKKSETEKSSEEGAAVEKIPERQVSEEDILEFTNKTGLSVFEASAKSGSGVESSFIALTDALIEISSKAGASDGRSSV